MKPTQARLTTTTALAANGVLELAGCSTPVEPSNLETPKVVWPDGEPFGQFKDDPAVHALALERVNRAIAQNQRDFSDADLVNVIGVERAQSAADDLSEALRIDGSQELTALGPVPYVVLDVVDDSEQSNVTNHCTGPGWNSQGTSPLGRGVRATI